MGVSIIIHTHDHFRQSGEISFSALSSWLKGPKSSPESLALSKSLHSRFLRFHAVKDQSRRRQSTF